MLICFPGKGSGGGGVYGCGVWRVKSWVKNVPNTNKYIAIFSIKWGWSSLTYLPLVVIIFEKSITLFYWTPYRGIDTQEWNKILSSHYNPSIEPLIGGLIHCSHLHKTRRFPTIEPLIGGLRHIELRSKVANVCHRRGNYWTPYRGIDTTLREWGIRNEQSTIIFLRWTGEAGVRVQHIGKWRSSTHR